MGKLDGKVVVITGAAGGMGEAHARAMVAEGAKVVATDISDGAGPALERELGGAVRFIHHDVRNEQSWQTVVEFAEQTFGPVTVLVNNAAIVRSISVELCSPQLYREIIEVNQIGAFIGIKAVLDGMRRAGGGSIINISSIAGLVGSANAIGYSDAKFAMRGMAKTAAIELGRYGIRVNTVHPGAIATDLMLLHPDFARYEADAKSTPLGRLGRPDEISRMVVFLASDDSSFSTGAEFISDGGKVAE